MLKKRMLFTLIVLFAGWESTVPCLLNLPKATLCGCTLALTLQKYFCCSCIWHQLVIHRTIKYQMLASFVHSACPSLRLLPQGCSFVLLVLFGQNCVSSRSTVVFTVLLVRKKLYGGNRAISRSVLWTARGPRGPLQALAFHEPSLRAKGSGP